MATDNLSDRRKRGGKWIQKAVPPSHRGLFTKEAKSHGEGVQEYASEVLAPGSKASTQTKRRAAFAKRAKKGF